MSSNIGSDSDTESTEEMVDPHANPEQHNDKSAAAAAAAAAHRPPSLGHRRQKDDGGEVAPRGNRQRDGKAGRSRSAKRKILEERSAGGVRDRTTQSPRKVANVLQTLSDNAAQSAQVAARAPNNHQQQQQPPPQQAIYRVLLTGGPCGGKSSALAALNDELTRRGLHTIVVPESSTLILQNSGGFDPSWAGAGTDVPLVALQGLMLENQIHMEELFHKVARLRPGQPTVLLHDRGCLDGKAFCSAEQWAAVVRNYNTKRGWLSHNQQPTTPPVPSSSAGADAVGKPPSSPTAVAASTATALSDATMLQRYDLVLHLTTAADGAEEHYEFGPGSKNPARFHDPAGARLADSLFKTIYAAHPRRFIVPNFTDWSSKLRRILWHLSDFLEYGTAFQMLRGELIVREMSEKALLQALSESSVSEAGARGTEFRCFEYLITYLDESRTRHVKLRRVVSHAELRERQDKGVLEEAVSSNSEVLSGSIDDNFALQCEYVAFPPKLVCTPSKAPADSKKPPTKHASSNSAGSATPSNNSSSDREHGTPTTAARFDSGTNNPTASCQRLISFAEYEAMIHSAGRLCREPDVLKRSFCFFIRDPDAKPVPTASIGRRDPYFELCQYFRAGSEKHGHSLRKRSPATPEEIEQDATFVDFKASGSSRLSTIWSQFTSNCFPGQMRLKMSHAALDHKRKVVRIPSWCKELHGHVINQNFARSVDRTFESEDDLFAKVPAVGEDHGRQLPSQADRATATCNPFREVALHKVNPNRLRATSTIVAGGAAITRQSLPAHEMNGRNRAV